WVVLTYETAKAAGLPLELLEYNVEVETAGGHTKAARLTLDRLAIGKLVERSVPALVVPHGQMKTNLLGMSFLDRLESWEVRADTLMLRGFPEPKLSRSDRGHGTLVEERSNHDQTLVGALRPPSAGCCRYPHV